MRHPQLLLIPPAVVGVGLLLPHLAAAYTSPHVAKVSKNSDYFYNYDFNNNGSLDPANVDMPMTMLWDCEAEIDALKDNVFDPNGWHRVSGIGESGSKYAKVYENGNSTKPQWDSDKGMQTDDCEYVSGDPMQFNLLQRQMHTRLYAPRSSPYYDQMYNTTWSYYVPASTHYDYNHADCNTPPYTANEPERFGWSEEVAERIEDLDDDNVTYQDESVNFRNAEDSFWWPSGGNHFHDADGYAARMCYK